jgi:hypothetical protein
MVLFLGFTPPELWQNIRLPTGKGISNPKNKTISDKAHRYRLERISRDRVCIARLPGASGFAGLFKTASNLYVACGLIFKGLIGYFSMITHIQSWGVNP